MISVEGIPNDNSGYNYSFGYVDYQFGAIIGQFTNLFQLKFALLPPFWVELFSAWGVFFCTFSHYFGFMEGSLMMLTVSNFPNLSETKISSFELNFISLNGRHMFSNHIFRKCNMEKILYLLSHVLLTTTWQSINHGLI